MIFRIYHKQLGQHVHMRVFSGGSNKALAKCGNLVMREEEFQQWRRWLLPRVQFIEEIGPQIKEQTNVQSGNDEQSRS